jgi:hypothetical protein
VRAILFVLGFRPERFLSGTILLEPAQTAMANGSRTEIKYNSKSEISKIDIIIFQNPNQNTVDPPLRTEKGETSESEEIEAFHTPVCLRFGLGRLPKDQARLIAIIGASLGHSSGSNSLN